MPPSSRPVPTPIRTDLGPREFSDEALISGIRAGDRAMAAHFYKRLYPVIGHALRRVLRRSTPDFDDMVQVTFARVVTGIAEDRFSGRSALTTWAAAIAGHVALDALRKDIRQRRALQAFPSTVSLMEPEPRLEARAEIERLQAVLARMKPPMAEAVILVDVLGHSVQELATMTDASVTAAQSRLHRGRKELVRRAGHSAGRGGA